MGRHADDGTLLALGGAALLGAASLWSRRGSRATAPVDALRRALSEAPRGSANLAAMLQRAKSSKGSTPVSLVKRAGAGHGKASGGDAPKYARLFLALEPRDVPDDLLVATMIAGATRDDPVQIATELLGKVRGNLALVADALPEGLEDDLSVVGRARLSAASELYRRAEYRGAARDLVKVLTPSDMVRLMKSMNFGPYEVLSAVYLDRRRAVIGSRVLTRGTTGFTIVDPQQVFRPAIQLGASAVVLGHHHPSGDPRPSSQDHDVTKRVAAAGRVLGIPLLDHLVVSGTSDRYTSFAEIGELASYYSSTDPVVTGG